MSVSDAYKRAVGMFACCAIVVLGGSNGLHIARSGSGEFDGCRGGEGRGTVVSEIGGEGTQIELTFPQEKIN